MHVFVLICGISEHYYTFLTKKNIVSSTPKPGMKSLRIDHIIGDPKNKETIKLTLKIDKKRKIEVCLSLQRVFAAYMIPNMMRHFKLKT